MSSMARRMAKKLQKTHKKPAPPMFKSSSEDFQKSISSNAVPPDNVVSKNVEADEKIKISALDKDLDDMERCIRAIYQGKELGYLMGRHNEDISEQFLKELENNTGESSPIDISMTIDNKKLTFPMTNKDLEGLELNKTKESSYYRWITSDESLEITTTAKTDDEPVSLLTAEFAYYYKFAFPYLSVESNGIVLSKTTYDETLNKLGTPKNKYESTTGHFRSLTYDDGNWNTVTFSFAEGDKCTGIEICYNN